MTVLFSRRLSATPLLFSATHLFLTAVLAQKKELHQLHFRFFLNPASDLPVPPVRHDLDRPETHRGAGEEVYTRDNMSISLKEQLENPFFFCFFCSRASLEDYVISRSRTVFQNQVECFLSSQVIVFCPTKVFFCGMKKSIRAPLPSELISPSTSSGQDWCVKKRFFYKKYIFALL